MSARIVVSCDGDWNGMPCRGALPTRETVLELAIEEATAVGWSMEGQRARFAEVDDDHGDLCPAHARPSTEATAAFELMRAGLPVPELDEPTAAWLTTLYGPDWAAVIPAPDRSRTR